MRGSSSLLNASSHTPSALPAAVSGIIDGAGDGDGAGVAGVATVGGGATEAGAAALPPPHALVRATTMKMRFMPLRKHYWNVRCVASAMNRRYACDACDACD